MSAERVAIVGLGYTGLPLAMAASSAGHHVVGYDVDKVRVDQLVLGESYIEDVGNEAILAALARGFTPTNRPADLAGCSIIIICVPTPLDGNNLPDLDPIVSATTDVGRQLQGGELVVLQSTTYPGTTTEIVAPLLGEMSGLQPGDGFSLAYSPERIDPGNRVWGLHNTPKVVGGQDEIALARAVAFFETMCATVVPVASCEIAEAAKLLENTYRHVNIALANEFALLCGSLGLDALSVIEAASTKPFGFERFLPGPGVGGHCIPVDPHYLAYRARQNGFQWRLVQAAEEINAQMPGHVIARAVRLLNDRGVAASEARVLLLGVAYKADVSDVRGTPAAAIAQGLLDWGADVAFFDPHVDTFMNLNRVRDPLEAATHRDLVVIVTPHTGLPYREIAKAAREVLDTRGLLDRSEKVHRI